MAIEEQIKQGDLEPPLEIECARDGVPVNLVDAESITVVLRRRHSTDPAVRRTATGDAEGLVTMAWVDGDTDTIGLLDLEVEVGWPNARPETFPDDGYMTVEVVPDLG